MNNVHEQEGARTSVSRHAGVTVTDLWDLRNGILDAWMLVGPEEWNLGCLDACVIVCLLNFRPWGTDSLRFAHYLLIVGLIVEAFGGPWAPISRPWAPLAYSLVSFGLLGCPGEPRMS